MAADYRWGETVSTPSDARRYPMLRPADDADLECMRVWRNHPVNR